MREGGDSLFTFDGSEVQQTIKSTPVKGELGRCAKPLGILVPTLLFKVEGIGDR